VQQINYFIVIAGLSFFSASGLSAHVQVETVFVVPTTLYWSRFLGADVFADTNSLSVALYDKRYTIVGVKYVQPIDHDTVYFLLNWPAVFKI